MSNQVRVGLLFVVALVIFIFGYSFLKGTNLFKGTVVYYATYDDVEGLEPSDLIFVNGLRIGKVNSIEFQYDENTGTIKDEVLLELEIDKDIKIPLNSIATLSEDGLFGDKTIQILMGDTTAYYKAGEFINTEIDKGMIAKFGEQLSPVTDKVENLVTELDSTVVALRKMIEKDNKESILYETISKVNSTLTTLEWTIEDLHEDWVSMSSGLKSTVANLDVTTTTFAESSDDIKKSIENLAVISEDIKEADLGTTLNNANIALQELTLVLEAMTDGTGTIDQLLTSDDVYNNLDAALGDLDALLVDIKENPWRYINISVFGGKSSEQKAKEKEEKKNKKSEESE